MYNFHSKKITNSIKKNMDMYSFHPLSKIKVSRKIRRANRGWTNSYFELFSKRDGLYQILTTIPITFASEENNFLKLELIKSHLHTIMSQKRLSGLIMISIENECLDSSMI